MTGTAREALLSAAGEEGPNAALHALRWAAAWAATVLADAATCGDDATALQALAEFDPARIELNRLDALVPDLLQASFPGTPIQEQAAARSAELANWSAAVAAQRAALDELQETEAALRETVAAQDDLRERIARLRRLERLAGALQELASQQQLIDDRIAALTGPPEQAEQALTAGCENLIRLSREHLGRLEPPAQALLERARAEQARLAAIEAEIASQQAALADAQQRAAQLLEMRDSQAAALRLHVAADREVADALADLSELSDLGEPPSSPGEPGEHGAAVAAAGAVADSADGGLARFRRLLAAIEAQLAVIDAALARTLTAREPGRAGRQTSPPAG